MKTPHAGRRGAVLLVALVVLLVLALLALAVLRSATTAHATFSAELFSIEAKYVAMAGLEYAHNGACVGPDSPEAVPFGNGTFRIGRAGGRIRSTGVVREATRVYSVAGPPTRAVVLGTDASTIEVWTPDLVLEATAPLRRVAVLRAGAPVTALALADLDRDGDLDLVAGTAEGGLEVWVNRGDCTFERPESPLAATGPVTALAVADLTGDGLPDVVVGTRSPERALQVFVGSRTGPAVDGLPAPSLRPHAQGPLDAGGAVTGLDAAPLDSAAGTDVVAAVSNGRLRGFLNDGSGALAEGFAHAPRIDGNKLPRAVRAVDLDGDGRADAAVGGSDAVWLAFRNEATRFKRFPHGRYATEGDTRAVSSASMDPEVDARPDVVLATAGGPGEKTDRPRGKKDQEEDKERGPGKADGQDEKKGDDKDDPGEPKDNQGIDEDDGDGGDEKPRPSARSATVDVWLNRRPDAGVDPRLTRGPGSPYPLPDDGLSVAAFDLDGDRFPDVLVGTTRAHLHVFRGDGHGALLARAGSPVTASGDVLALATGLVYGAR